MTIKICIYQPKRFFQSGLVPKLEIETTNLFTQWLFRLNLGKHLKNHAESIVVIKDQTGGNYEEI